MDCATFTSELADVLGGPFDPADPLRAARVEALARHAADCGECRAAAPLVDLVSLPPAARARFEEPPAEFWTSFERGLEGRLDAERRGAAFARKVRWFAVAGVLVALGGAAVWGLRGRLAEGERLGTPPAGAIALRTPDVEPESAQDAAVADALAEDPAWDAFADEPGGPAAGLFPVLSDLDEDARASLYRWLVQEEARLKAGRGGGSA